MRVYTLAPQGDPELANVVDTVAFLNLSARLQREGADRDDHWSEWDVEQALANVTVRLYDREVDGSVRWPADAPWNSRMDRFVKDTVDPVFAGTSARLLPVACESTSLRYVLPPIVPALDVERSVLSLMPGSGRVIGVKEPVFKASVVAQHPLFKDGSLKCLSLIYVTDAFVDRWKRAGLRGLEFEEVWRG